VKHALILSVLGPLLAVGCEAPRGELELSDEDELASNGMAVEGNDRPILADSTGPVFVSDDLSSDRGNALPNDCHHRHH